MRPSTRGAPTQGSSRLATPPVLGRAQQHSSAGPLKRASPGYRSTGAQPPPHTQGLRDAALPEPSHATAVRTFKKRYTTDARVPARVPLVAHGSSWSSCVRYAIRYIHCLTTHIAPSSSTPKDIPFYPGASKPNQEFPTHRPVKQERLHCHTGTHTTPTTTGMHTTPTTTTT